MVEAESFPPYQVSRCDEQKKERHIAVDMPLI